LGLGASVKKWLAGAAFLPGLLLGSSAFAAAPVYNWTGCYIGVHGGGGAMTSSWASTYSPDFGGVAGAQLGCNYQAGFTVWGVEAEGWWSGMQNRTFTDIGGFITGESIVRNRYDAAVSARAGLAFDRTLIFGKAGIAFGNFEFSSRESVFFAPTADVSGRANLSGILLGIGIEYGLTPRWSAKIEYDYINYALGRGSFRFCGGGPVCTDFSESHAATKQLVKGGLNYRFGGPDGPMMTPAPEAPGYATIYDWSGSYIGVQTGGGLTSTSHISATRYGNGAFWGGQVGYNYQVGSVVFGIEAGASQSSLTQTAGFVDPGGTASQTATNRWNADLSARVGLAFDRALFFGKVGIAWAGFDFDEEINFAPPPDRTRGSTTLSGLLLGAGLEYGLGANWSAKLEYNYVIYPTRQVTFTTCGFGPCFDFEEAVGGSQQFVKAGLNYRFGGTTGSAPRMWPAVNGDGGPVYNWSGFYLGVNGGGGLMTSDFVSNTRFGSGGLFGGQIGYNYQHGMVVLGAEAEAWWAQIAQNEVFADPFNGSLVESARNRWGAAVSVRGGVAFDRALIYAKGGIAYGAFDFERLEPAFPASTRGSVELPGLLLGVGIEYGLDPNLSAKFEYNYINYALRAGSFVDCFAGVCTDFTNTEAAHQQLFKAGLNYRVGGMSSASLPRSMPYDWTGCYIGAHGGIGTMASSFADSQIHGDGGLFGGQAGCNYQIGRMVFGVEAQGSWSGITQRLEISTPSGFQYVEARNRSDVDIAGRIGVTFDRSLWYGKVGIARGAFDYQAGQGFSGIFELRDTGSAAHPGLLLGAGVEYGLMGNWSAKLEYNYVRFMNQDVAFTECEVVSGLCAPFQITTNIAASKQVLKTGINYRFTGNN
jgi:outer membrane immunogenic protein